MHAKLSSARLLTMAAILTAAVLLPGLPAGASAARSGAQLQGGNVAFLSGGSLDVVHADGAFPGEVMQVTPPGTAVWAAWSPKCDNDARLVGNGWRVLRRCWIAYIDANDGSLWLTGNSGYGNRLLLAGSTLASTDLSWSPDGREIAITSPGPYRNGSSLYGCGRIYLVPIDGSGPTMVPGTSAGCNVAWSPRGNEIAYVACGCGYPGHSGVTVIHPDGSGRLQVSRTGWGWVGWSADGTQLAFAPSLPPSKRLHGRYSGIGVVDADGSDFHIVTTNAYNEYPAVWSPKGHQLLYGGHGGGIYVIDADGQNNHRVTTDSPVRSLWPALAWSPDGNSIVYDDSTGGLYQVGVNGRGKVQLTSQPNADLGPSWVSPGWFWG